MALCMFSHQIHAQDLRGVAIFCCLSSRTGGSRRKHIETLQCSREGCEDILQLLFRPVTNNLVSGFYSYHVNRHRSLCGTTLGHKCMKTLLRTDKIHTHSAKYD